MGFTIVRVNQDEAKAHFLADASRRVMIEIYRNPRLAVPDYQTIDPLQSHLAFACNTIEATIKALEAAGATLVNSIQHTDAGDRLAMLRDPWGLPIQLCKRAVPMV
jgi:uncharacterized glyoxalase superfamily protein PhnB